MESIDLNFKWENISLFENKKGYKALRINPTCKPDLFLAIDNEGYRCLLLYLPSKPKVNIKEVEKDKLSLCFLHQKNVILITLKNFEFIDLFNDLITSIFSKIKLMSNPDEFSKEFIITFKKWSEFFEDTDFNKISEAQIQGLFGELFVLNDYLSDADPTNVDLLTSSWKGLYDSKNDFEFDSKNVEVKTKKESKPFIKISSEFQLEKEFDKGLELLIVTVKIDLIKGRSIHDLLIQIIKKIRGNFGDTSILYLALKQKGLTIENLKQYNNHRFIVLKTELLDATDDKFPKLHKSNIPEEISSLNYKLRITQMDEFLIDMKKY